MIFFEVVPVRFGSVLSGLTHELVDITHDWQEQTVGLLLASDASPKNQEQLSFKQISPSAYILCEIFRQFSHWWVYFLSSSLLYIST